MMIIILKFFQLKNTSGVISIRMGNEIIIDNTQLPITGDYDVWKETNLDCNLGKAKIHHLLIAEVVLILKC